MSEEKILTFRGKRVYLSSMVCNICNINKCILNNYITVVSTRSYHLNLGEDFIRLRGREAFSEFCIENPEFKPNSGNCNLNLFFDSAIEGIKKHRNCPENLKRCHDLKEKFDYDNTILTFRGKRVYLSSMVCNICNIKKTTLSNYVSPSSNVLISLKDNEDILHLSVFSDDYYDFVKENPTVMYIRKAAHLNLFYESALRKINDYRNRVGRPLGKANRDEIEKPSEKVSLLNKTSSEDSFVVDLNKIMITLLNLIQENKQMSNKISILENRILELERMSMSKQYSRKDNPEDLQSLLSEYLSLKRGA